VTEVYFPFVDTACTRDWGLLVADRHGFFSEEKADTQSQVEYLAKGVPGARTQGRSPAHDSVVLSRRID
jgi:glucoamylase